ncbi:MAG: DNA-binding protein [Thermoprotei archaeon]|nr:MAG: DNA-binding protein [Thermoprotei archaeon]
MRSTSMARAYIVQALERLKHSREALATGNYPYVVRQCQEAVELLLKASLRLVGIEPPKWHDVGPVLRREAHRFPEWFRREVPRMARISRRLRREREPAMYGDEETGTPPNELYDKEDAEEALRWADYVASNVLRLYRELVGEELGSS